MYLFISTTKSATKYVYFVVTDFPLVTKYNCLFFVSELTTEITFLFLFNYAYIKIKYKN